MNVSFLDFRLLLTLVMILPLGFAALLLAARAWGNQQRVNAARGWRPTTGRVIAASVETVSVSVRVQTSTSSYRAATRYAPAVQYEYFVHGARYYADRLHLGPRILSSEASDAQWALRRYPVGSQVIVWYNPANPAESALDVRAGWGIWIEWAISGALFLLAVGLAAFLWV